MPPLVSFTRLVPLVAGLGLAAGALVVVPATVADAAATPTCETTVLGVLPSGRILKRDIRNTQVTRETKTASPAPYPIESMYNIATDRLDGGPVINHMVAHAPGRPVREFVLRDDGGPTVSLMSQGTYRKSMKGRTFADSGRYYSYGIDPSGNLKRWTRFQDSSGHLWFDDAKVVKRGMGSVKSMAFLTTVKLGGVRKDLLYATTKGGALKQFQIPWGKPASAKVTTVKSSGFAAYNGLSLSWCNATGTLGSIIAIDRAHNRAVWYTLAGQFAPKPGNLVRRGAVAPGAEWRLHATS